MRKIKVGILTLSDGRDYIYEPREELNRKYQRRHTTALARTKLVEVVMGEEIIWNNAIANREGRRLTAIN